MIRLILVLILSLMGAAGSSDARTAFRSPGLATGPVHAAPTPAADSSRAEVDAPRHLPAVSGTVSMRKLVAGRAFPASFGVCIGSSQPKNLGLLDARSQECIPSSLRHDEECTPKLFTPASGDVYADLGGTFATWFCDPPRSRCTRGVPPGTMAVAAPYALRIPKGTMVRVCLVTAYQSDKCVTVRVVDVNMGASWDLVAAAFVKLAPLSVGRIAVTVAILGRPATLPETSTGP